MPSTASADRLIRTIIDRAPAPTPLPSVSDCEVKYDLGANGVWTLTYIITDRGYADGGYEIRDPQHPRMVGWAETEHILVNRVDYRVRLQIDPGYNPAHGPIRHASIRRSDKPLDDRAVTMPAFNHIRRVGLAAWQAYWETPTVQLAALSSWADYEINEAKRRIEKLEDEKRALKTRITEIVATRSANILRLT